MDLELLLAHADTCNPVLERGFEIRSLFEAPRPTKAAATRTYLSDPSGDPSKLSTQRWGIIAPEGPRGERLLDLIAPLRRAREQAQGADARVYRVPPRMDILQAITWERRHYWDEKVREEDRPRYLLILGDLDEVSLELQQVLSNAAYVGRLCFPDDAGFEAYTAKVLRWEREAAAPKARSLFFTVHDNTEATNQGYARLVVPALGLCRTQMEREELPVREVLDVEMPAAGAAGRLLEEAAKPIPSVLFTLSHGLGAPRGGWASGREQREHQGAMSLGSGARLTASELAQRPFLPGGLWFYFACFSAGTPSRSAYFPWLKRLQETGEFRGRAEVVLGSLPREDRPFIARLPQTVLANPNGPLGVIGHVDLAWTYSFLDEGGQSHPSRFVSVLRPLLTGRRAGVGISLLTRFGASVDVELAVRYGEAESSGAGEHLERARRGHLWMSRHDLYGYILLGDPAAQISLDTRAREAARPVITPGLLGLPVEPPAVTIDPETMENAVLEFLAGNVAAREIAARHGVSQSVLREWEQVYRSAGCAALRAWRPRR